MSGVGMGLGGVVVAAALVDWAAVAFGRRRVELVSKPAVMVALIGFALALDPVSASQRAWFVAALVASLAGDAALLVRGSGPGSGPGSTGRRWFAIGLAAFLVAHLAYIGGFAGRQQAPGSVVLAGVLVWLAVAGAGSRIVRGAAGRSGWKLGVAVAGYLTVLSVMTVLAAGSGSTLAAVGAGFFFLSDALLGWDRFVDPVPGGRLPRRIAYHLGQGLLVLSLLT